MNNPSPLVPQGSLTDQKNRGRARVKIAVFVVLSIHGIGLLALLMQGCKKEPDAGLNSGAELTNTNTMPAFAEPTNTPPTTTNETLAATNMIPPEPLQPVPVPTPMATDYKVAQGDSFTTIARKFHVSVKAISDANPGVESTKLKVGQTLHIPAPSAPAAPLGATGAPAADAGGEQTYTVQSGDNLTTIAAKFKVTVRALRSANALTTDKIKVGQKLKIPARAPATAPAPGATTPTGQ
jgi:LysM repeat protein